MDSTSLVVDQQAMYHRRGSNTHGHFYPSTPQSESMTLQQQQQLLNLLNAHAAGGGSGAGASGLGFLGARGNGAAAGQAPQQQQKQQHVPPPHSYAAVPLIRATHVPSHPPPPPRPAYSSMPTPRLLHQHSNPPLLPLPFSRSSSLPPQVPARPHVNGPPRKPGAQVAAPRTSNGPKEQQKSTRPSKQATCGGPAAAVIRPKKEVRSAEASNKVETTAKQPNVPVGAASDNKVQEASTPTAPAAAAAKEKKPDVRQASEVLTVTGSTGFSVYSLAPHPSSLPLPRLISLRPKAIPVPASCNAEALGGVADGADGPGAAADDLRRLLRL